MTVPLPDTDALVRGALAAGLAATGAQVFTLWPDDWTSWLPLVVARRVGGSAVDPRGLDAAVIDVQCAAADRSAASLLARQAGAALFDACTAQWPDPAAGGYLSHFGDDVSGPAEIRTGSPAAGPDMFRFQATYRVTARPLT
ncbi:hypothetical protein F4556_005184 [Kitasatospora gansuensis]|uniref:Tail terminator n=1 Tax=Kitasatospora gansuensis TaxID=258050 RepID=A0A7W7WKE9_9ACTN|nr:hypothetical protein [Kitasatospora gansuensis]MBB4949649.1 hypothetical protein [Kitasatospora gansuensis]